MKLTDSDDNKMNPQMGAVVIATVLVLFVILGIAIIPNLPKDKKTNSAKDYLAQAEKNLFESENSPVLEELPDKNGIESPQDLDFWSLYPADEEGNEEDNALSSPEKDPEIKKPEEKKPEDDPSTDGKHTLVINRDGKEEWVLISQYLQKNDYDYSNLVSKNDRLEYYIDSKKVSYIGIDVSKYQDYIDFVKVAKDGISFVMIRLGNRGYGTGQITIDDYFFDNIKRATDAGLEVGIYFSSQAISAEEAEEEAQTVLDALGEYRPSYPICFDMEFVKNDTARIEVLSKADKTSITKAFLDKINENGYTGMIYGDKEWLIKEIDMSKLTEYDVWLAEDTDLPDYPYKFSVWQYKKNGSVDGVSGYVPLNISFVDYTEK